MRTVWIGAAALLLAGCGGGSGSMGSLGFLNPFSRSEPVVADTGEAEALLPLVDPADRVIVTDRRVPVEQVTALRLERTPEGSILTATGLTGGQGAFNAELVLTEVSGRTATYTFRVEEPARFTGIGPTATRQVTAATMLTPGELAGLSRIVVVGRSGSRAVSP